MKIATWNVNSVRFRQQLVTRFLPRSSRTCCACRRPRWKTSLFPALPFHKLGYVHQAIHGQKAYHGVAVLSRIPSAKPASRISAAKAMPATWA